MKITEMPKEWEDLLRSMIKFFESLPGALRDLVTQQGHLQEENRELRARVLRLEESMLHLAGGEHLLRRESTRLQRH